MPELPEVETVVRGIRGEILNKNVASVLIRRPALRYPIPKAVSTKLTQVRITKVYRRSKYILIDFANSQTLLLHLGMSGTITFQDLPNNFAKHDHFILQFAESGQCMCFNDPRRFGIIDLFATQKKHENRFLQVLGPEPLEKAWSYDFFYQSIQNKRGNIKSFLMNAKNVVGIGNIYAAEALFLAGIHPMRLPDSLEPQEVKALHQAVRKVLRKAIQAGGSSLRDFRQTDGSLGYFSIQFAVYGREGQACKTCGTTIENIKISGRSSFFCPQCQS